ncbi:MAG: ABC transporter permease subunit [Thermoplasmata archaeon]
MATVTITGRIARRVSLATSGKEALKGTLLSVPSSLWFILFLILPIAIMVLFGLATISKKTFSITYDELTAINYLRALDPSGIVITLTVRTILVSAVTAVGCLAISYPVAYYLARLASEANRGFLISLIIIPFWISFVVQVYALYPWTQRGGYVGQAMDAIGLRGFADWLFENFGFGSANIVAPVLIWIWLPFMILPLFTALLRIDRELLEAAQDLGAGKWKTFSNVTFPLSFTGVVTGSMLVFITAFGSFVEPKLLSGREGNLVGNYIYENYLLLGNLPTGAAASIVVLVATVVVLYIYVAYAEKTETEFGRRARASEAISKFREWISSRRPRRAPAAGLPNGKLLTVRQVRGPAERFFDRLADRHGKRILQIFTALVFLTFYVPLAQVVIFSFNQSNNIVAWSQFSLRWYVPGPRGTEEVRALFGDRDMMAALGNSIMIGLIVTALSILLGTPAALAVVRYRFGSRRFLNIMLYTGLVIPSIVMGVSILAFITFLNDLYLWPYAHVWWDTGYFSIIVGHVTFSIPIVIVVLIVSLHEFDRSLEEAAMNLGANEWTTFFKVTLPIIKPGIVSAALLSFTFSFDELIVTLFLKGQGVETLPVVMWSTLSRKIPTPELNAAATLILAMAILFTVLASKVQKGGTLFRF